MIVARIITAIPMIVARIITAIPMIAARIVTAMPMIAARIVTAMPIIAGMPIIAARIVAGMRIIVARIVTAVPMIIAGMEASVAMPIIVDVATVAALSMTVTARTIARAVRVAIARRRRIVPSGRVRSEAITYASRPPPRKRLSRERNPSQSVGWGRSARHPTRRQRKPGKAPNATTLIFSSSAATPSNRHAPRHLNTWTRPQLLHIDNQNPPTPTPRQCDHEKACVAAEGGVL